METEKIRQRLDELSQKGWVNLTPKEETEIIKLSKELKKRMEKTENQENKKLCNGLPIGIQTKQEHEQQRNRAKHYFLISQKQERDLLKKEIVRAEQERIRLQEELKELRNKKFLSRTYAEWVLYVREINKEYVITENEDSIKIKEVLSKKLETWNERAKRLGLKENEFNGKIPLNELNKIGQIK